jgi:TonB family protein
MRKLFLLPLLITGFAFAQKKQNVYFLKNNGREVAVKDSADFIRIIQEPDSGSTEFILMEFYKDNHKKRFGTVSKFEPALVYEGTLTSYFPNGKLREVTIYKKGKPEGDGYFYYRNGQLKKTVRYNTKGTAIKPAYDYPDNFKLINFFDSTGTQLVKDGKGFVKEISDSGNRIEEGNYLDSLKDGEWKGQFLKSGNSYTETYQNGKCKGGKSTLNDGTKHTYTYVKEIPQFKGGMKDFYSYVGHEFRYPPQARINKISGKVLLTFVIEKDGSLSNIKLVHDIGYGIGKEALRVLRESSDWLPGTEHGIPVRTTYSLPIMFNTK